MTFPEAIKTCLFKKYCTAAGRASRSEFWWFYLFTVLINFVVGSIEEAADPSGGGSIVSLILSLLFLLPTICVTSRRLHDIGLSGWWQIAPYVLGIASGVFAVITGSWELLVSIILIMLIVGIYVLCKAGTSGPNRFGMPPGSPAAPSGTAPSSAQPVRSQAENSSFSFPNAASQNAGTEPSAAASSNPSRPCLCPSCGAESSPDASFCSRCGANIAAMRAQR